MTNLFWTGLCNLFSFAPCVQNIFWPLARRYIKIPKSSTLFFFNCFFRISHQHSSTCDRNHGCESSNNNEETVWPRFKSWCSCCFSHKKSSDGVTRYELSIGAAGSWSWSEKRCKKSNGSGVCTCSDPFAMNPCPKHPENSYLTNFHMSTNLARTGNNENFMRIERLNSKIESSFESTQQNNWKKF